MSIRSAVLAIRPFERHLSVAAFFLGFCLDLLTLPRIDHPAAPYIVGGYGAVALLSVAFTDIVSRSPSHTRISKLEGLFPGLFSFSSGAIMSFLFVYYLRSASIVSSWPFLVFLFAVMVGNEVLRARLSVYLARISLVSLLSILLAILYVPIALGEASQISFLLSVVTGLVFVCVYVVILLFVLPAATKAVLPRFLVGGLVFACLLVGARAGGILPAVPLVLKNGDVYGSVARLASGEYALSGGGPRSWATGILFPRIHPWTPGEPVYFYSAVYAPTTISGSIVHEWQMKDPATDEWETVTRVAFPIHGGRAEGYRGYSVKENVAPGRWRVVVELSDGQVIGRVPFVIERG